jgi:hypothetical protein
MRISPTCLLQAGEKGPEKGNNKIILLNLSTAGRFKQLLKIFPQFKAGSRFILMDRIRITKT